MIVGVARILSGVHFSSPEKLTTFLVVAVKTVVKTNLSHRPDLSNFLKQLDSCSASGGSTLCQGCTYNFPL